MHDVKLAAHTVETACLPFQCNTLPGWLHLQPGYQRERIAKTTC